MSLYVSDALPVDIRCLNDVVSTSIGRNYVASTLIRCHFYVMCPLGCIHGNEGRLF